MLICILLNSSSHTVSLLCPLGWLLLFFINSNSVFFILDPKDKSAIEKNEGNAVSDLLPMQKSNAEILALQLDTFPKTSVAVSVTVLGPRSAQVKFWGEAAKTKAPQGSEVPLSRSAPSTCAFPLASRNTVMFWHWTSGAIVSCTVTVA